MENPAAIILKLTQAACQHGSDNLGNSKQVHDKLWQPLLAAFTQMHAKLETTAVPVQDRKILQQFFTAHCTLSFALYGWQHAISKNGFYVRPDPEALTANPGILSLINKYCPLKLDKTVLANVKAEDFWSLMAVALSEILYSKEQDNDPRFMANAFQKLSEETTLLSQFEAGTQFTGDAIKPFITKMLNDVKHSVYTFGFGNCALMADTAYLWAIQSNTGQPVHYLRIRCRENSKVDVINLVAIGAWPAAGCTLVIPWGKHGILQWGGSLAATPALTHIHRSYNDIQTICSLMPAEQKPYQQLLETQGFAAWSALPERQAMHERVQKVSAQLFAELQTIANAPSERRVTHWKSVNVAEQDKQFHLHFEGQFFQGKCHSQAAGRIVAEEDITLNDFTLKPGQISPRTSRFFSEHEGSLESTDDAIKLIGGVFTAQDWEAFRRTRNMERLHELTGNTWKFHQKTNMYWTRVVAAEKGETEQRLKANQLAFQVNLVKESTDYCLQIKASELLGEKETRALLRKY